MYVILTQTLQDEASKNDLESLTKSLIDGVNAMPPVEFVKSIHGHYCVPATKTKWLGLLGFLFDETLLHPHALVYCDEAVPPAAKKQ